MQHGFVPVFCFSVVLVVCGSVRGEVEEAKKKPARAPAAGSGLDGVRSIDMTVEFSRLFSYPPRPRRVVRRRAPRAGLGADSKKDALTAAVDEAARAKPGDDPLQVALRLSCTFTSAERWSARVDGVTASFNAPPIQAWAIDSTKSNAPEAAARAIERLAPLWRFPQTSAEQHAILESQLVALALFLLEGRDLAPVFDRGRRSVELPELGDLLEGTLPEAFPLAVFSEVEWFLRSLLERAVAPGPVVFSESGEFSSRGIPFRVEKVRRRSSEQRALVEGGIHDVRLGLAVRESASIDARDGWLLESRALVVHAPMLGETDRFGAERWHFTRTAEELVPEAAADGESR